MIHKNMGWSQEYKRAYYAGLYKTQSYSYPHFEEVKMKRPVFDAILGTIINGLLICLILLLLLAAVCSAAVSAERWGQSKNGASENGETVNTVARTGQVTGGGFHVLVNSGERVEEETPGKMNQLSVHINLK